MTVKDLISLLSKRHPPLEPVLKSAMIAVNLEYVELDDMVKAGDEVAVIPPVSGGVEYPNLRPPLLKFNLKIRDIHPKIQVTQSDQRHRGDYETTENQFYNASEKAILNGSKAIRGGIPLVFPVFGTVPGNPLPQHGFARTSKWSWSGVQSDTADSISALFELKPEHVPADLYAKWPHPFALAYHVTLSAKQLVTKLVIRNTGSAPFDFTTLLHTYFKVKDISTVGVTGLQQLHYVDKVLSSARAVETRSHVAVSGEVDRVYEGVKNDEITIEGVGFGDVKIVKYNFPDVVVWNPWSEKANAMADFGDEEYHNMICVEVGSVSTPVSLAAAGTWEGSQILSAL
ncbi:hypothetical protein SmJEL517_g05239 [Synchytrium microbalum]|uniref:glucose-6-phosphate 1-epimerase n=1 Tax=Synchytrium microbalum TaxID=1806994 RepID=A0A507C0D9_9FUNG|nr:uncharacterized protein SmJEL517_g05239 [Synchytrium microbalum]TPX31436.1 hypothetical protein SmJEL517_g05239 [Synchytrium microbalum]